MVLYYRFTSGVHAVLGNSPWDTARTGVVQDAIPTTRLAFYDAMVTALVAAGWERFERKTAGASVSQATRDDLWYSTGEDGKKHILMRTAIHAASGGAGTQYFTWIIGAKRNNAGTALSGTWTWGGTTTVTATDTSQVIVGSYIKLNTDGQWFKITAIVVNTNVTIDNTAGWTIPSGATGSSVLTPNLEGDVGNAALGNTAPFNTDIYRWDLGVSDFSADYQMVLNKDSFNFVLQDVAHTGSMFVTHIGDFRPLDCNPNVLVLDTTVVAGDFVELLTVDEAGATVNPIALGYRPLDRIRICNVDPQGIPRAETQAIVRVQSDRIVVRRLRFGYDGLNLAVNPQRLGARMGMNVQPIFMNLSANLELEIAVTPGATTNHLRTVFFQGLTLDGVDPFIPGRTQGDLVSVPTTKQGELTYFQHYGQLTTHAQVNTEYGAGVTGNARTLRFTLRSTAFGFFSSANDGSSIVGKIPKLATYNGTVSFYPHDNMKRDRVTPNEDFVPFRYTSASARNYVLGPTPGP